MPAAPPEPQSFLTNLRLVASPWHLFIFVLHPALAVLGSFLIALTLKDDSVIPAYPRMILFMVYVAFSTGVAIKTREDIQARLLKEGYVQRYSQWPMMEYGLNLGGLCVMFQYLQSWRDADVGKEWTLHILVSLWAFWFAALTSFLSVGTILYFTARTMPARETDAVIVER